ncbi:MAG: hypothetical protein J6Y11_00685 [Paludibacteraceae bacterium]|nr:hypothetical protein [Paludibacteraceae bacterium]
METIDIVLKAVLELKEQVAVLSYKMDNLENMLANSSFRVSQKREDITDPIPVESNEQETAEEKLVRLYNKRKKEKEEAEPEEPEEDDFILEDPFEQEDPFENKRNLSSEDLSALIKAECQQAFPSDSSINEDYINQSLINGSKKEDVSSTTKATLEEVKKRVDEFMDMNKLQYNINKHI